MIVLLKRILYAVLAGGKVFFFNGFYGIRSDEDVAVYGAYDAAALGMAGL